MGHLLQLALTLFLGLTIAVIAMPLQAQPQGFAAFDTQTSARSTPLPQEKAFVPTVLRNEDGGMTITWQIAQGYYLYRAYTTAEAADGTPVPLDMPQGIIKDDPTFGASEVYYTWLSVRVPPGTGPFDLTWQGCQEDGLCYPPVTRAISGDGDFIDGPLLADTDTAPRSDGMILADQGDGMVAEMATRGGPALVLVSFLGLGLLLAFTPCVFPMFPILAGMLARQGESLTPARGAMLSGTYVIAMAAAFGLLGMVAAWSGQNLQMALQSPLALGIVAGIFVLLAMSMFGLFNIQLPAAMTERLSRMGTSQRGSVGGAALLGFSSALIVGPCVTAPLAGGLLYIAQTGDVALGAGALFALGLGQGIPLFVAGTFGARVLPRAGAWMDGAKRIFGFVFLGMAIWLGARLVPGPVELVLWAVLLIAVAVFLGATDRRTTVSPAQERMGQGLGRTLGLSALLGGVILAVGAAMGNDDPLRPLAGFRAGEVAMTDRTVTAEVASTTQLAAVLSQVAGSAVVYVTADWCVTCRTIDRRVLPDAGVQAALDGLTLIKVDVTDTGPESQAVLADLGAVGPPTMIFLDASRSEVAETRLIGKVTVETLTQSARALQ